MLTLGTLHYEHTRLPGVGTILFPPSGRGKEKDNDNSFTTENPARRSHNQNNNSITTENTEQYSNIVSSPRRGSKDLAGGEAPGLEFGRLVLADWHATG